jgi:ABC-2 type transport system permease protein
MGAIMKTFWNTFIGEFKRIVSDRGAILIFLVASPLYAFFYPLPYLQQIPKRLPICVVDYDHSEMSRLLSRRSDENELVRVQGEVSCIREAERLVRDGDSAGVLYIPKGFEKDVKRGGKAVAGAYVDATYFLPYRQVLTGLTTAAAALSAGVEVRRWESTGVPREQALRRRDPLRTEIHSMFNPEGGYGNYVVPAVLILIFQQTLLIGIGLMMGTAREAGGSFGFSGAPFAEVWARASAYVGLYLGHFMVFRLAVYPIFGFPFRAGLGTAMAFLISYLYACVFMGFALGRLWRERESAMLFLVFTSLPALFLCGFAWPKEALPTWLRFVSQLLPTTVAIPGYLKLVHMGALSVDVLPEYVVLAALVLLYYLLSTRPLFRRKG